MSHVTPDPREGSGRRSPALLDESALEPHDGGGERRALGSDPFESLADPDPFLAALGELGLAPPTPPSWTEPAAPRRRAVSLVAARPQPAARPPQPDAGAEPTPLQVRRWVSTPALAEVEEPDPEDWLDRLLEADDRRRLAALAHLVEGESPYDRFGLSSPALRRTFPLALLLYRLWFRTRSTGHEHIPASGPAVLAGNHAGLLPFDAAMTVLDVVLHSDPPRLARAIVDRWAGSLPFVNVFFARVGQVVGTRENFAELLREGQLVLVYPEGMEGVRKLITQRYRLQPFRVGFVEQALLARAPIVPVAVIGSDDQAPILFDVKPVAQALGLPVAPITPTFPWLGPLGLVPYPVRYRIVYGEPLHFQQRFGPEDAEDSRLVRYLARQVRRAVQGLIDRHRSD